MLRFWTHAACLEHRVPAGCPEVPQRLAGVLAALRQAPIEEAPEPTLQGCLSAVAAVHPDSYVERFRRAVERGDGLLDSADNPLASGTFDAACAAVSAALAAAEWTLGGEGRHAFAAVRPPGHHCERDEAMGFCYFNNVAVAAEHLRQQGVERVAIVDFDVHHGNGTQHLFEERSDILFVSLHQHPLYPGTGLASERGFGPGQGSTLNLPLAAGTDDEGYERAFQDSVLPALHQFRPRALLISAGFDAWRGDPLGGMGVSEKGYRRWGQLLAAVAAEHCRGCTLSLLEGGYDLQALPELVVAYLQGLEGSD